MSERIVLLRGSSDFLHGRDCNVIETYEFDDDLEAALIDCDEREESSLADHDRVVSVDPNYTAQLPIEPEYVSADPDRMATIEDVRELHDVPDDGDTGAGYTVVAMDSGVDTGHPVFDDDDVEQVDVTGTGEGDAVGHGTAVLGQVTQLAPGADLVALRIFGEQGQTKDNVIMRAYEWLHGHADEFDVVNMSWGSQETSRSINEVHNSLVETGVRCVVSAGNSGERSGSPATAERAFSIAACTEEGAIAEFSSYNPDRDNPDVAAIGKDNKLAQADGTAMGEQLEGPWVKSSGTSFSAPEVAGMVAKYLDVRGETPPETVMRDFEAAARNVPDQPRDGAGLADYEAAVAGESDESNESGGTGGPDDSGDAEGSERPEGSAGSAGDDN
ncbi:S8 family peptidase [Candidatus Halobonum tyrrellensis]|uniref:Subtilisin-like serine protease n=1 Tax=Candidatus Halobonum tyrrellensis G22 TaxID=1324957 RepID=V4GTE5_9EURY|nr:S8 family serine peptidase [Candidatus Halobonum tyrrellensis]ESP88361.1 subtilisin-like serine protease [Candidatus Halobonum tyrrellensis G22]